MDATPELVGQALFASAAHLPEPSRSLLITLALGLVAAKGIKEQTHAEAILICLTKLGLAVGFTADEIAGSFTAVLEDSAAPNALADLVPASPSLQ